MLKIPWTEKVTNLGHVMRNKERSGLLQTNLQGKIFGRREPGRRRTSTSGSGSIKHLHNCCGLLQIPNRYDDRQHS